jgi:FkbM family methyltransferase
VGIARTAIERLSRNRIIKRRLPHRFAPATLYVSPDSQLRYLKIGEEAFDRELLQVVDEHIREDSTVWDIGANVGVFAFAAASVARRGSTFAVEPDIWLAQLMRRSLRLKSNCDLQLTILPAAISGRCGVETFMIAKRGRASNALESAGGRTEAGGVRERVTVPTLTLDTLIEFAPRPSFVKIDVEGAELSVLKGAARLLREIRPTVYIEVGREYSAEVTSILAENGYRVFDGSKAASERQPMSSCAFNTLAVPSW